MICFTRGLNQGVLRQKNIGWALCSNDDVMMTSQCNDFAKYWGGYSPPAPLPTYSLSQSTYLAQFWVVLVLKTGFSFFREHEDFFYQHHVTLGKPDNKGESELSRFQLFSRDVINFNCQWLRLHCEREQFPSQHHYERDVSQKWQQLWCHCHWLQGSWLPPDEIEVQEHQGKGKAKIFVLNDVSSHPSFRCFLE